MSTDAEHTSKRRELEAQIAGKVCRQCKSVPRIAFGGTVAVGGYYLRCNCYPRGPSLARPETAAEYVASREAAMVVQAEAGKAHPRSRAEIEADMASLYDTENR